MGNSYSTVNKKLFLNRMVARWSHVDELGLGIPSSGLKAAWGMMADTFSVHIQEDAKNRWSVLPIPTGGGKTEGLAVYCAMLAKQAAHPGVLIVTRLIDDADKLANKINAIAKANIALCDNSEIEQLPSALRTAQVLIVTHVSFRLIHKKKHRHPATWKKLMEWQHGKRRLVVIDESLDIIEHIKVTLDDIKLTATLIPKHIGKKYGYEMSVLHGVIGELEALAEEGHEQYLREGYWEDIAEAVAPPNFTGLLNDLRSAVMDVTTLEHGETIQPLQHCKKTLEALDYIVSPWHWSRYSKVMDDSRISSAYVLLPVEMNNAVVLDATAEPNWLYTLMGSVPHLVEIPDSIRDYSKATLNVFWGYPTGKVKLSQQPQAYFDEIMKRLHTHLGKRNKVLVCTSKAVRERFENYGASFKEYSVAHWGAITGKNDWKDYDAMVICGLPSLDSTTPKNIVQAFADWHDRAGGKTSVPEVYYDEVKETVVINEFAVSEFENPDGGYGKSHTLTNLVQAINRVRCRQPIDSKGRCKPTQIYLFLNKKKTQQPLIDGIVKMMPGIKVTEHESDKPARLTPSAEKIVNYLRRRPDGIYDAARICKKLRITVRTTERTLGDQDGRLESALQSIGVRYEAKPGNGGFRRFIKGKMAVMEEKLNH